MTKYFARVKLDGYDVAGIAELTIPIKANCSVCGKEMLVCPRPFEKILALACGEECKKNDKFWNNQNEIVKSVNVANKTEWDEQESVPLACDKDEVTKEEVETLVKLTCPECGGHKRGRGFAHNKNCSLDAKNKLAKTEATEVCPLCGGRKKGRGFIHANDCKNSSAARMAMKMSANKGEINVK